MAKSKCPAKFTPIKGVTCDLDDGHLVQEALPDVRIKSKHYHGGYAQIGKSKEKKFFTIHWD